MWDKMTLYDSDTKSVMEFNLVSLAEEDQEQQGDPEQQQEQQGGPEQQQEQQGGPEQQDTDVIPTIIIKKHVAKLVNVSSRQDVVEQARQWPCWVQIELSKALNCLVRQVPTALADYMGWTNHEPENSEKTESEANAS